MAEMHAAWLLALAFGIVSSGLTNSVWKLATDEELQLLSLFDAYPSLLTPFRVAAVVIAAPTIILLDAFWWLIERPLAGVPILAAGLLWSFLQGVFILTQVFGFT